MKKYFNTTGTCFPDINYMVDISNKIEEIIKLIKRNSYFVINRPRQYGKTTTLNMLENKLNKEYLVVSITFEGIGDKVFSEEGLFSRTILDMFYDAIEFNFEEEAEKLKSYSKNVDNLRDFSKTLTKWIKDINKEVILIIDEVDKSANNQLFLSFLGVLRSKYLLMRAKKDYSFKSVILAGVHDVKTLKLKFRNEDEKKYNSPWNIAVNFDIDMSFSSEEIEKMLLEYSNDYGLNMNTKDLSKEIYFFTSGYPFLVSRVCQIIDENFYKNEKKCWKIDDIKMAVKYISNEKNTLNEDLMKNLENNEELYELIKRILLNGENVVFNSLDPIIDIGVVYGILKNKENRLEISNKIFEEIIYNYMTSKLKTETKDMTLYNFKNNFITKDNGLDMEKVLIKFQSYIRENYSTVDREFIEREGRIIFMAFLSPIINGVGFAFKEVQISEEKRLDIVVTYNKFKYIIELKVWNGEKYHKRGKKQLKEYLDIHNLNKGYLLVFNFNKKKEYKSSRYNIDDKEIFEVFV